MVSIIKTHDTARAAADKPVREHDDAMIIKAMKAAHNTFIKLRENIGNVASVRATLTVNMVTCFLVGAFESFKGNDFSGKLWLDYVSDNVDSVERAQENDDDAHDDDDDDEAAKAARKIERNHDGSASINRNTRAAMLSAHKVAFWLAREMGKQPKLGTKGELVVPVAAFEFLNRSKIGTARFKALIKTDSEGAPILSENTFVFDALEKTANAYLGRLKEKSRADKDATAINNAAKIVALLWKVTPQHKLGYAPGAAIKAFERLQVAMLGAVTRRDAMIAAKAAAKAEAEARMAEKANKNTAAPKA